jgi:hypothetical protein
MGSNRRHRERRPARGAPRNTVRRRLLIVCEGVVTEPDYLYGLERWARNNTVQIDIPPEHGVPLTLVRRAEALAEQAKSAAKREGDAFLAYDEVWCAFDIDEHPNIDDACQLARARGIQLAVSNPCFELWILLHFRESPGALHRRTLQRMVGEYLPGYDKHLDFERVAPGLEDAVRRARRLDRDAQEEGESGRNPSTGFYRLADSIVRRDDSHT